MESPKPLQRSQTLPPRLRHSLGAYDSNNNPSNEVLFHHRSAKIVKFELPQTSQIAPPNDISSDLDYVVDAVETLPWRLPTERIVALGHMKIENVPGSTIFLKSGSVVQTLMKNCQCWCVDGTSIFVIRIRRLTYYRIELPHETEHDKEQADTLKHVLSTLIRYEVTPCPFKRGFSVEIPEEAKTPRRKKAWRPKLDPSFEPRKLNFTEAGSDTTGRDRSDEGSIGADTEDDVTDESEKTPKATRTSVSEHDRSPPISVPSRATRILSEPTHTFDSLMARFQSLPDSGSEMDGDDSLASSVDSFHSFQSSISPLPPSPPYSDPPSSPEPQSFVTAEQLHIPAQRIHNREASEATVTHQPTTTPGATPARQQNHSPPLSLHSLTIPCDEDRVVATGMDAADPDPDVRQRLRSRRRELSPLPPPSTLYVPSPRSPVNNMTALLLQKTCSLVIGTPIQVLAVLLHIAARIANGERSKQSAYDGNMSDSGDTIWSEDDFGIPLSSSSSSRRADSSPDSDPFDILGEELD
ncbi:hypothetical protein FQN55_008199 [Onygenales sp. PD_40]|nr:hypothetical protein FQN55_008199 [Onygenales sp. PD_40]KAK2797466.1 hypothetical protein FQN51_008499 [Onygenales sp. PD_10]